jgi:hypothetical protein
MFSPVKFALFALISFVALALATSSPGLAQDHKALIINNDPRALIDNTNHVLEKALLPLCPFYLSFCTFLDSYLLPLRLY